MTHNSTRSDRSGDLWLPHRSSRKGREMDKTTAQTLLLLYYISDELKVVMFNGTAFMSKWKTLGKDVNAGKF